MIRLPPLRWKVISSAEQRCGRYTIVADWTDTEVRVFIDGQPLSSGFGSVAEAKGWCSTHYQGAMTSRYMLDSARQSIPDLED